jgi:hypothetical protein
MNIEYELYCKYSLGVQKYLRKNSNQALRALIQYLYFLEAFYMGFIRNCLNVEPN